MNLAALEHVVGAGESETVELKRSTGQLHAAGKTLCAFLNAEGGTVVLGVSDSGRVLGQEVADKTRREIAAMIGRFEPAAPVGIEYVALGDAGKWVIVLQATSPAEARPFTYEGRAYHRVQTTTSVMPQERYEALLLDRAHAQRRWENQVAIDATLDHLDHEQILRTVRLGIQAGRLPEGTGSDIGETLDRLKLRSDGRLRNAAVALFGTDLASDFPQCQIRLARFKGVDKSEFLDNRQEHGHAFGLLEVGMAFLLRNLPIAGRFEAGRMERIDEPLFPVAALREALVNAICHRDYSITGGCVSAAIFDDRLEIWSDGRLPFGQRVEVLKRPHRSLPRNPLISGVFFRRGLVEEWGRGTQMIVDLCVRAGHPEPEFLEESGAVGVRFLASGYLAPHRVAHDLTARQREILQVLARRQHSSFAEIRDGLRAAPSDRSVRNDLTHLRTLGLAQLSGRGRGARWSLETARQE